MRKVNYHVATSLDGFVARVDGSFDCFAMEGPHVADYVAAFSECSTAIMGRKTYEVGLKSGVTNPYPMLDTYVFSSTMQESPDAAVKVIATDAVAKVRELRAGDGKDIFFAGAGELAASLLASGLIDEIHVKVNPIVLGQGVPLVAHLDTDVSLTLLDSKTYDNGVVLLRYRCTTQSRR